MSSIKVVLNNILNKNYQFCGICFESDEENFVSIDDEVVFKKNGTQNTLKVSDMLIVTLDEEVYNIISTFGTLCKQCIRSAVTSYKFLTMSRENCLALEKSLASLMTCIDNTEDNHLFCQSLFVTLNPTDFSTQQYYDPKNPVTSLSSACRRLESLMNPIKNDIKPSYTDKSDDRDTEFVGEKPRKNRKKLSSLSTKTSEMLYDKNDRTTIKCRECQQVYPTLSNLRSHFIRVHAPKDYKCSICNRRFGSISILEAHKYQSHCTIVCSECGKTFHNRHTLKMHEIGHYKRIICQDCGRVYKSQTTFKKHIDLNICGQKTRADPSQAKFTCDYCNKKYTQKVSLRVHIQYEHGNYKAHECKWCNKKFWAKSRLKAHVVKHTQEKKFSCNICGGKYVTKESLLYHTRTHTGEKPYQCHLCDNRFVSASRRADHIKRHHAGASLQCPVCKVQFVTQASFEKHKKMHTNNEEKQTEKKVKSEELIKLSESDDILYLEVSGMVYTANTESSN